MEEVYRGGADLQQIDEGLHTIGAVNSGEGERCE